MSEGQEGPEAGPDAGRAAFRYKSAELAVAALFFIFGAIVIYDSVRLGFGWQEVHGPRPGYFPFYIALLICISAVVNFARALWIARGQNKTFVQVGQLKLVLTVLIPTALYAALVTWIGIYASSVLFIGFFMRWLGKYPWWKVLAVSLATVVGFYLVFEIWFKVPLPKGPVESLLGLN
jgi:putative tricarboxylic transport membrane protein